MAATEFYGVEKPNISRDTFKLLGLILSVFAAGFGVAAAAWGIWYAAMGSIPKFLGISRLWQDAIAAGFWVEVILLYVVFAKDKFSELAGSDHFYVSFWDFVTNDPLFCLLGLFIVADIVVSAIWFSLAAGLVAALAVVILVFAGYCAWRIIRRLFVGSICAVGNCTADFTTAEDSQDE